MSKMLVYVEEKIVKSVTIKLHFDDNSIKKFTAIEGEEIALKYLYKRSIIKLQGIVKEILINRFGQTTLKLDISTKNNSGIVFLVTDNIRDFLTVDPDSPSIDTGWDDENIPGCGCGDCNCGDNGSGSGGSGGGGWDDGEGGSGGIVGDGIIDTIEEIVEELSWQE